MKHKQKTLKRINKCFPRRGKINTITVINEAKDKILDDECSAEKVSDIPRV